MRTRQPSCTPPVPKPIRDARGRNPWHRRCPHAARLVLATSACLIVAFQSTHAQAPAAQPRPAATAQATASASLPVRRVVLYKNGIGYFEHLGRVVGNDTTSIDFSSSQLDDVLNSLTVIDLGDGRIDGISYNSDAPLGERLGSLRLAIGDRATLPQLLDALRGARLEVRIGDRVVRGRLLGVERRVHGAGATAESRDELTIVSDAGEIRIVAFSTLAASIRLAEPDSANQVGSYLGLLASTRAPDPALHDHLDHRNRAARSPRQLRK